MNANAPVLDIISVAAGSVLATHLAVGLWICRLGRCRGAMGTLTGSRHHTNIITDKRLLPELGLRVLIPVLRHGDSFLPHANEVPHPKCHCSVLSTQFQCSSSTLVLSFCSEPGTARRSDESRVATARAVVSVRRGGRSGKHTDNLAHGESYKAASWPCGFDLAWKAGGAERASLRMWRRTCLGKSWGGREHGPG